MVRLELRLFSLLWMILYCQLIVFPSDLLDTFQSYLFYTSLLFLILNDLFTFIFWLYKPTHLPNNVFDGEAFNILISRQLKFYVLLLNMAAHDLVLPYHAKYLIVAYLAFFFHELVLLAKLKLIKIHTSVVIF